MRGFIDFLTTASKQQQIMLLKSLTYTQLKLLIEIIYNVVMDNIPITNDDKKKLIKHKSTIRKVLVEGLSLQQRRKRLLLLKGNILYIFIKNYLEWQKN